MPGHGIQLQNPRPEATSHFAQRNSCTAQKPLRDGLLPPNRYRARAGKVRVVVERQSERLGVAHSLRENRLGGALQRLSRVQGSRVLL